ncbi:hypothetical protein REPUB_Repub06bG0065400 [Reevesia pubescens]
MSEKWTSMEKENNLNIVTVFVNNLPPSVYRRWVWQIFFHHGKVVDVFIPKKKNVNGRCFGFVRFASRDDATRAVKNLNGAWLLDYRLSVNFARFSPRVNFWKKSDNNRNALGRISQKGEEKISENAQHKGKSVHQGISLEEEIEKPRQVQQQKSYLKALVGSSPEVNLITEEGMVQELNGVEEKVTSTSPENAPVLGHSRFCVGEIDIEALHKLEKCLIGTAKNFCEAKVGSDFLISSGISEVSVKKYSGNQFLIEFKNDEARNKLELQNWAPLKEWFCVLQPWSVSLQPQSRLTWVNVFGVPLHVWNYSTFQNIASLWGEIISFDDNTFKFQDFCKGSMQILTKQMGRIEEVITLK